MAEQEISDRLADVVEVGASRPMLIQLADRETNSRRHSFVLGWCGIMAAASVYPTIVLVVGYLCRWVEKGPRITSLFAIPTAGRTLPRWTTIEEYLLDSLLTGQLSFEHPVVLLVTALAFVIVSLLAIGFAGVVGGILMLLVNTIHTSLRPECSTRSVVAFTGGLTGFACYAIAIPSMTRGASLWNEWFIFVLLGPGLTTLLGQIGGAWAASNNSSYLGKETSSPRLQFRVRHMLIATAWTAGLLTFFRLTGWLSIQFLAILITWIIYQTFTLWLVLYWFERRRKVARAAND